MGHQSALPRYLTEGALVHPQIDLIRKDFAVMQHKVTHESWAQASCGLVGPSKPAKIEPTTSRILCACSSTLLSRGKSSSPNLQPQLSQPDVCLRTRSRKGWSGVPGDDRQSATRSSWGHWFMQLTVRLTMRPRVQILTSLLSQRFCNTNCQLGLFNMTMNMPSRALVYSVLLIFSS